MSPRAFDSRRVNILLIQYLVSSLSFRRRRHAVAAAAAASVEDARRGTSVRADCTVHGNGDVLPRRTDNVEGRRRLRSSVTTPA